MLKLLFTLILSTLFASAAPTLPGDAHRVVVYYQHQYPNQHQHNPPSTWGNYISPLPLVDNATHLIVAAVHINDINSSMSTITINDTPPNSTLYDPMWKDLEKMKKAGVKVMALIGGAQPGGCFWRLSQNRTFDTYYPHLKSFLQKYKFDGVDLDVEDAEGDDSKGYKLSDMISLIDHLKADFGKSFIISQAPIATAMLKDSGRAEVGGISGFSYFDLEAKRGSDIAFYNVQFYEGHGTFDMAGIEDYQDMAEAFTARKIVASTPSNPANVQPGPEHGFVDIDVIRKQVLPTLVKQYGAEFGGIASWEYYNSLPGGEKEPQLWAHLMKQAMRRA